MEVSDGSYAVLDALARLVQVAAWFGIIIGAFLRGTKAHGTVGVIAEGAGWVALVTAGIVDSHAAAQMQVNCSVFGVDCIDSDAEAFSYLWQTLLRGIVIDLLLAAVAEIIGWGAGRFWTHRHPAPPH